uniref:Serine/Arginine-related protein 53-like n=1 Tax=Petromyzon marinus TaxID=7757 RepID=A0AAJ7SK45_PETMA|nr:serine/Arginine-related protein 53-like [Petromyzon marinus]
MRRAAGTRRMRSRGVGGAALRPRPHRPRPRATRGQGSRIRGRRPGRRKSRRRKRRNWILCHITRKRTNPTRRNRGRGLQSKAAGRSRGRRSPRRVRARSRLRRCCGSSGIVFSHSCSSASDAHRLVQCPEQARV